MKFCQSRNVGTLYICVTSITLQSIQLPPANSWCMQLSSAGVTAVTHGCLFMHWTAIWAKSEQLTLTPPVRSSE